MSRASLLSAALLGGAALISHTAHALPSFGSKIPNGERVPCPPGAPLDSCPGGYCRGLGHDTCAGGTSGLPEQVLSSFGQDWRDAGFEWTADLCQADSDGDGYTNGEELGDPCCVWSPAQAYSRAAAVGGVAEYTANFVPSHPGNPDDVPADYVRPSCDGEDMLPPSTGEIGPEVIGIAAFNPGEEQRSFDVRIKEYAIPRTTTTYVDFVFNIPEEIDDIVHIVYGEVINTQPKHLHHFVVTGCSKRIEEEREGMPLDKVPDHCNVPVGGFSGWAPGVTMWGMPTNAGVPIGKGFGIEAISVNVHYTDGDAPYLNGEQAIATDGFRVHYTPDLRPKTVTIASLVQVGFGPPDMNIEPGKKRAFLTRTCTVSSKCKDTSDESMSRIGRMMLDNPDLTCSSGASMMFCQFSEPFASACPESCGLCADGSPRKPTEFLAVDVNYHAHVIGREMYTTLIPKDDPEARIDLESQTVWTYEDQEGKPLQNIVIKPGDKIQTTCVYDSTTRDEVTQFDLATYDEMCLNGLTLLFDTPTADSPLSAANEIAIRGFTCDTSEEGDIWLGELGPDENGLLVMDSHPRTDAECTFPTGLFGISSFDGFPTSEKRCNGEIVTSDFGICAGRPGSVMNPRRKAGISCRGGLFDEKDENDGTTQEQCVSGGGMWVQYNCREAQDYLDNTPSTVIEEEVKHYLRDNWWAPKCCMGGDDEETEVDSDSGDGDVVTTVDSDGSSGNTYGSEETESSPATSIAAASGALLGAASIIAGLVAFA